MTNARTIVLLGGSGLGPWVWERVTPILNARRFLTLAPELPATGDDGTPAAEVSLIDWITEVTDFLAAKNQQGVALVAHSFAGYIAAGVLARDTGRIGAVVFLDAVLPQPGKSWFDLMGPAVERFMSGLASNGAIPWFSRDQLDQLYPGHGISEADYAWMQSKLRPQPIATFAQAAITEPLNPVGVQLAYVRCLRTTPPAADINENSPSWVFRTLDTGHWPMITDPVATAQVIEELARPRSHE